MTLMVAKINIKKDTSFADLVLQVLTTCGKKVRVEMVPAM
jgi:type IV secretory pathway VirB3-like protein